MATRLDDAVLDLLPFAPGMHRLKLHPGYEQWRERLLMYADRPGLAEFRDHLTAVAEAGPWDLGVLAKLRGGISTEACLAAARIAIEEDEHAEDGRALVLAAIATIAWFRSGSDPYKADFGELHPAWGELPYACALAGLRARAFRQTLIFVERVHGLMLYATTRGGAFSYYYLAIDVLGNPLLPRYRAVAHAAADRYEATRPPSPILRTTSARR